MLYEKKTHCSLERLKDAGKHVDNPVCVMQFLLMQVNKISPNNPFCIFRCLSDEVRIFFLCNRYFRIFIYEIL